MKILAGAGLITILTWTNLVWSSVIFVDLANTTGPWDGSAVHPFQHIQNGVNAAAAGDEVSVASGTYYESVTVNAKNISLTTSPLSRVATVIQNGLNITNTGTACHVTGFKVYHGLNFDNTGSQISNCTFSGSPYAASAGSTPSTGPTFSHCTFESSQYGVYFDAVRVNAKFVNCTIQNNTTGIYLMDLWYNTEFDNCTVANNTTYGVACGSDSYPKFTGTIIRDNGTDGVNCSESGPILMNCQIVRNGRYGYYGTSGDDANMTNCLIADNNGTGVSSTFGTSGGGWCTRINNCTIANNGVAGIDCEQETQCSVINSIVYFNTVSIYDDSSNELSVGYSCVAGASGAGDPLFADATNADVQLRDYHLKSKYGRWNPSANRWVYDTSTSPCIDAGDPDSDYSGELCRNGSRINMGYDGNTHEASLSGIGLPCSDLNHDMVVNMEDIAILALQWMVVDNFGQCDIDRSGTADFGDFAQIAVDWLTVFESGIFTLDQTSGTTAINSSPLHNNGVLVGTPAWVAGRTGNCLQFNALTQALQISTSGMNPEEGSICVWVCPAPFPGGLHYIVGHTSTAPAYNDRIQLYIDGNGWLYLGMGAAHPLASNIYQFTPNNWYHLALTWDQTTCSVYVNGELTVRTTNPGLSQLGTFLDIGNDGNTSYRNEAFSGKVEDVHVYAYRLCGGEIWGLYAQ